MFSDLLGRSGVAVFAGGDVMMDAGVTAGGGYFTFDTRKAGGTSFTGRTYGFSEGLGVSMTFFGGSGTSLLDGRSTNYNVTALILSLGVSYSSKLSDGLLGITAISIGVGVGLPIGANVSNTNTIIHSSARMCSAM